MDACLLCDPNSEPRGSGAAPICPSHQQARAAFEGAELLLRAHLEQAYGAELDGWVQPGVVPGLTWQVLMREPAPAPAPGATWRPGRLLQFQQEPEGVVRLLRELLLSTVQQERRGQETAVMLRVGTPDGRRSAGVSRAIMRDALQRLVAELVTVDSVDEALRTLPVESAARAIIDGTVAHQREPMSWSRNWASCRSAPARSRWCGVWTLATACW